MKACVRPGLYALASLDGSLLSPADLETLGLSASPDVVESAGMVVRLCDRLPLPLVASIERTKDSVLAFAGYLDEPEELAAKLSVDSGLSPAALALLALDRFGPEAPARMVGEWSLLRWSAATRELTLLCSENLRDPIFWATDGRRVAVAANSMLLGRLPWVGLTLNPLGLPLELSRAGIRRIRGSHTLWRDIHTVAPATRETFSLGSQHTLAPVAIPLPSPFQGDFEEAIAALNALGRRIVGQNLRRYRRAGFLLSGGIDSTLVTTLGAQERGDAVEAFCVTSVAPEGSALADEREFSLAVAEQLGLPIRFVAPDADASAYAPSPESFAFTGLPVMTPRHYLYSALQHAARGQGANVLFDGVMGEMSITEKPGVEYGVDWVRRLLYAARFKRKERRRRAAWPVEGFHARFSGDVLATLPREWRETWRAGMPQLPRLSATDLRGLHPALAKNSAVSTATPEGLRRLLPFRDRRLVRFAATLPYGFGNHEGQSRAMARAMLRGHIPESVRLRPRGLPFSPDYERRLQRQAPVARDRIHIFREAGIGRWLDLDWLDGALQRIADGADAYAAEQNQTQITAMAAEFLFWCRSCGVQL